TKMYRYYCDSFTGLSSIIDYFVRYPLKTNKATSFKNWLKVYTMVINKEHLSEEGLSTIRGIKRIININSSLSTKTGSANP
ncbi:LAGLIDADG family homing endonuclease, partial [Escherichia coli]|uniref:LAGLIDADG family homing endonuclease n=1 Tax=Escherichia coli TaxID=562 RepID=UPI001BC8B5EA